MYRLVLELERLRSSSVLAEDLHRIKLAVVTAQQCRVASLMEATGNAPELLGWFRENRDHLLNDNMPLAVPSGASIALRLSAFYDAVDPDSVRALDEVYEYRWRHGLRFALRGLDIEDVYIGMNMSRYEISCAEGQAPWAYEIDLESFLRDLKFDAYAEFGAK